MRMHEAKEGNGFSFTGRDDFLENKSFIFQLGQGFFLNVSIDEWMG